jgi:putative DNA primase/helicase
VDGIGFVTGGGIVALDWDECCDEVTREVKPEVAAILRRLNTYAEYSPSGRGVRAFLRGKLPGDSINSPAIELYDEPNYVTVTGFRVPGTPAEVAEGGALLVELYEAGKASQEAAKQARKAAREAKREKNRQPTPPRHERPPESNGKASAGTLSDEDIVAIVRRSANASTVEALLAGQWEQAGYGSQSEADMALADHLAFYAGPGGEAQVERLMLNSGLKRDKYAKDISGRSYLAHTVAKAFEGRADFYSGKASTGKKKAAAAEVVLPNGLPSTGPACLNDSSTLTDVGLARRLVLEANGTLRYVKEWKSWLAWDGKRWVQDDGLAAQHVAKRVGDELWREAAELPAERRNQVATFVKAASSSRSIDAAVKLARSEPGVVVGAEELNQHNYLLNCLNGTVDLLAVERRPAAPGDLLTHLAQVEFDEKASAPTWKKFVADVTNGNAELAAFLQRSCGYLLCGDVSEQVLWLHYGEGRNGKSTLLTVMSEILGTYAGPAPLDMLLVKNRSKEAETQFAPLAGRRLVTAVEADSGVRFSEATVKLLTGGDTVLARRLYESPWPLRPTWKLHVAANHKPLVRGTDEGIWRRLMLTPWLRRFEGATEDKRLKDKLLAERSGILNWCLVGFSLWRGGGLKPPDCVLAATKEYRGENDILGTWLAECCLKNANAVTEANALYRSYRRWCEDSGEHPKTATAFGLDMERLGFTSERPSAGQWRNRTIRRGLGILDERREAEA